jgi:hypothetical protein
MIKSLNLNDLVVLEKEALFPPEFLLSKKFISHGSIEDEKGLIGSFFLTDSVELSIILSRNVLLFNKVKALRELEDFLLKQLRGKGISEVHTFVKDPNFANILVQHFGFEYVVGRALIRRL